MNVNFRNDLAQCNFWEYINRILFAVSLSAIVRKELEDRTVLFRSLCVSAIKAGYGNKRTIPKGRSRQESRFWAFFMDGLVQHCRRGEVFMTEIQDHYARNINIIKTSCPVISIASHRTHCSLGGNILYTWALLPSLYRPPFFWSKGVGITKRCRLSWLTNSALVLYMSPKGEWRGCAL